MDSWVDRVKHTCYPTLGKPDVDGPHTHCRSSSSPPEHTSIALVVNLRHYCTKSFGLLSLQVDPVQNDVTYGYVSDRLGDARLGPFSWPGKTEVHVHETPNGADFITFKMTLGFLFEIGSLGTSSYQQERCCSNVNILGQADRRLQWPRLLRVLD